MKAQSSFVRIGNLLILATFLAITTVVEADVFGIGNNAFTIDFTTIGNPGNIADTTGLPNPAGTVSYNYQIGTYEISEDMVSKANYLGGLSITVESRNANKPASGISWNEAARFVNWLNTSMGYSPAYKFAKQPGEDGYQANADGLPWVTGDAGYNAANPLRNTNAHYFLPTSDEWYKAAYYDPISSTYYDYPTGSNTPPTPVIGGTAQGTAVYGQQWAGPAVTTNAGGLSPYGTMAQGGNIKEWNESSYGGGWRIRRGGHWFWLDEPSLKSTTWDIASPNHETGDVGFRVASVSEPTSAPLIFDADIRPAIELAWPTQIGKSYTIECSTNLTTWSILHPATPGTGARMNYLDSIYSRPKVFYRVKEY